MTRAGFHGVAGGVLIMLPSYERDRDNTELKAISRRPEAAKTLSSHVVDQPAVAVDGAAAAPRSEVIRSGRHDRLCCRHTPHARCVTPTILRASASRVGMPRCGNTSRSRCGVTVV